MFHWWIFVGDDFTAKVTFRNKKTGVVHSFENLTAKLIYDDGEIAASIVGDGTGGQLEVEVADLTSAAADISARFVEYDGSLNPRTILKGVIHVQAV